MSIIHCLGWGSKTGFLLTAEPCVRMLCWLSHLQKTSCVVWCCSSFNDNFIDMNLEKFHQVLELFELQANMSRSQRQLTRLVWNPVFPFTERNRTMGTSSVIWNRNIFRGWQIRIKSFVTLRIFYEFLAVCSFPWKQSLFVSVPELLYSSFTGAVK